MSNYSHLSCESSQGCHPEYFSGSVFREIGHWPPKAALNTYTLYQIILSISVAASVLVLNYVVVDVLEKVSWTV